MGIQNDENHMRNAGKALNKGGQNAADEISEGRVLDATESVWEGTTTAAGEVVKSAADAVAANRKNRRS